MDNTTLTPKQVKVLVKRAREKANERRIEEARQIAEQERAIEERTSPVDLDTAVRELVAGSTYRHGDGSVSQGLTEADILAAYDGMTKPTFLERAYQGGISAGLQVAKAMRSNMVRGIATVVVGSAVAGTVVFPYAASIGFQNDEDRRLHAALHTDVMQARQEIAEAYAHPNKELRVLQNWQMLSVSCIGAG